MLLQFSNVSKYFGSRVILDDVSFRIDPSEKIGLIGPNGAGKTTLLKVAAGWLDPDGGNVFRKAGLLVGALEQLPDFHDDASVLQEALHAFDDLQAAEAGLRDLEDEIARGAGKDLLERYAALQQEFELRGGYRFRAMTEAALLGVGFRKESLQQPARTLSGGEKNRLALAKLLLSDADLLLLDEPTNHLDIRSIEWLERFVASTSKTVIVVSHDRTFLERVAGRIVEFSGTRLNDYRGGYSFYLKEREARLQKQRKEWELQQEWIARQEDYIRRNIAGQKTKQAQSRRKLLARVSRVEKPRSESASVTFRFRPAERGSRHVVRACDLAIGYHRTLAGNIEFEVERGQRWAILGTNGSGKTTLLRTLMGAVAPVAGEIEWNEGLDFGYYDQQLADLNPDATVLDELRGMDGAATDGELRSWLGQFLFSGDDVFKPVDRLSGGEKSRLSLAKIVYQEPTLLVLDEPTNHLDIASREALETALQEYPGAILFVTHDRYLARRIATHWIYLENGGARVFDRLSAFEAWLSESSGDAKAVVETGGSAAPSLLTAPEPAAPMSKNRREKLQNEAAGLETRIASLEAEVAALETAFANPDPQMNWEAENRRYAELRETLDSLYSDLDSRLELIDRPETRSGR